MFRLLSSCDLVNINAGWKMEIWASFLIAFSLAGKGTENEIKIFRNVS